MRPYRGSALLALGLASAMHLDWHFARPAHHQLSLGWSQHWLVAIPIFMLAAWYVCRAWPRHVAKAGAIIIGAAAVVAQVIEPLYELLIGGAPFAWAFGADRQAAFAAFTGVGIVAYVMTTLILRRRTSQLPAGMVVLVAVLLLAS